jgi:hypothetical protein
VRRELVAAVLSAALLVAACGGTSGDMEVAAAKCVPKPKCATPTPTPTTTTASPSPTVTTTTTTSPSPTETTTAPVSDPPAADGYFTLAPVGGYTSLPSGPDCQTQVRYSTWEPRPDNAYPNHNTQDAAAVHTSLSRQRSDAGAYNPLWFDFMLDRVDGQFAGRTDEHFQWAACKWGLPDNLLRAMAVRESTWFQYEVYPSGRPVNLWGSGDYFPAATVDSKTYCDGIAVFGRDYQADYGDGLCPKTFSILGIMSWQAPSWGQMPGNQNGTFPFNRNSTGFAVDYLAGYIRGCYEGWETWLGPSYAAGDLWGCVGVWYAGDWHSTAADGYISRVQTELADKPWLGVTWPDEKPACSDVYGCPVGWTGY